MTTNYTYWNCFGSHHHVCMRCICRHIDLFIVKIAYEHTNHTIICVQLWREKKHAFIFISFYSIQNRFHFDMAIRTNYVLTKLEIVDDIQRWKSYIENDYCLAKCIVNWFILNIYFDKLIRKGNSEKLWQTLQQCGVLFSKLHL